MEYICKDNPDHKKFKSDGMFSTLIGGSNEYDEKGRPLHPDPNWHTENYICLECNKEYTKITYEWKITFHEGRHNWPVYKEENFYEEDITPYYIIKDKEIKE